MGFSAGGHLAALLCSMCKENFKPNFMALIYAALEDDFKSADYEKFPPTFIITCNDDKIAPAKNSVEFFDALVNKKKSELHIYSKGGHGFGLGIKGGAVSSWKSNLIYWLQDNDYFSLEN